MLLKLETLLTALLNIFGLATSMFDPVLGQEIAITSSPSSPA